MLLSLFTDARADNEEPVPDEGDPGGWWGELDGDRYGSKIWLMVNAKLTDEEVDRARIYTEDALGWMLEDQVADELEIVATRLEPEGSLGVEVTILRGSSSRWDLLWDGAQVADFGQPGLTVRLLVP